ncbi:Oidioi.mRNA.OKI2018_I69.chr1.g1371.t1.cds [Oikopleura dioica]|uniref:Oidioi.mRNA.OKI2018_I69.chr1.g1371.t1.cds n=1 Tax=Oikopleura dioica TaxID=34765 RepID=A0ABN7SMP7_OIKDI|nr:Oidioi.mRNA.OKI2018_I69.chr1.g1371.t1.cds [Oikopleura dioica]
MIAGTVICVLIILFIGLGVFIGMTRDYQDICHAPDPFILEDGVSLILSPPTHPTCEHCSTDEDGNESCSPGCFVYDENKNCPLTIKSQSNQIRYEIKMIDIDPTLARARKPA